MKKAVLVILLIAFCSVATAESFNVYFLDVGQGDAAIVTCDGYAMMIDGGPSSASQFIYSYLRNTLDIQELDAIICSHPHADHIGGVAAALNACLVLQVFTPLADYDSRAWNSVLKYAAEQDAPIIMPLPGDSFYLGSALVEFVGPLYFDNNLNNISLVVKITYGKTSILFTGDMEVGEESDLVDAGIDLKADVLKVGHHGSDTSSSLQFLEAVSPEYAIISVGANNSYGHPSDAVIKRIADLGSICMRTDRLGTISLSSDGANVRFSTERSLLHFAKPHDLRLAS